MALPPQRTESHRIDTLAVRRLMSELGPDWIIRDVSDRDYGIDLAIEFYKKEHPTGKTAYFQVKGKQKKVSKIKDGDVTVYKFPVKTLLYAEFFPQPFFLIHLSTIRSHPIYFLWLQKYIRIELEKNQPNWRTKDYITLKIPKENDFLKAEERVRDFISHNVNTMKAMAFLVDYEYWTRSINDFISNGKYSEKDRCIKFIKSFKSYSSFIDEMQTKGAGSFAITYDQAIDHIDSVVNTPLTAKRINELILFRESINDVYDHLMMTPELEEYWRDCNPPIPPF